MLVLFIQHVSFLVSIGSRKKRFTRYLSFLIARYILMRAIITKPACLYLADKVIYNHYSTYKVKPLWKDLHVVATTSLDTTRS